MKPESTNVIWQTERQKIAEGVPVQLFRCIKFALKTNPNLVTVRVLPGKAKRYNSADLDKILALVAEGKLELPPLPYVSRQKAARQALKLEEARSSLSLVNKGDSNE